MPIVTIQPSRQTLSSTPSAMLTRSTHASCQPIVPEDLETSEERGRW